MRTAAAKLLTSDEILIRSSKWEEGFSFTMHPIIASCESVYFSTFLVRPEFVSIIHKLAGKDKPLLVSVTSPCSFPSKVPYSTLRGQREVHPSACS